MSADENTKAEPWHRRFGRDKFLRPWLLILLGYLYVFIYLVVAVLMFVLGWIVPHLPWIPKPYVVPTLPRWSSLSTAPISSVDLQLFWQSSSILEDQIGGLAWAEKEKNLKDESKSSRTTSC